MYTYTYKGARVEGGREGGWEGAVGATVIRSHFSLRATWTSRPLVPWGAKAYMNTSSGVCIYTWTNVYEHTYTTYVTNVYEHTYGHM